MHKSIYSSIHYLTALVGIIFALGFSMPALGQAKSCCNTQTGEFLSIPKEACNAKLGHISYPPSDPADAMKAMICFQKTIQQAQEQVGGAGTSVPILSPDIGGGQIPTPDVIQDMISGMMTPIETGAEEFECCNTDDGQFIGSMSEEVCRAKSAKHYPDTPEFMAEADVCRPNSGGGGGAWDKEDFEENIENGGMEKWRDENRPTGFTSYGVPPSVQKKSPIDFQVSFRSNDAHTGQYSLRLKNADIASQLPPEAQAALKFAPGARASMAQRAGVGTCKDPCPIENQKPTANSLGASLKVFGALPSDDVKSHVCGAYKGIIGRTDELALNITLSSGGSAKGAARKSFTKSSSDWIEFSIPMTSIGGALPETGDVGIAAQIMPRGASKRISSGGMPPIGQPVSILTDVNVDSIHFCDPTGLVAYHPEVIAGNTNSEISESEEDTLGVQTFVNLDNDDADGKYDMDDDKVEGDNELVRLKMYLPMNSFGKVEFNVSKGDDKIALWDDADKSKTFDLANKELEVEELLRATPDGSRFEREVWVEAVKPSTRQGDVEFEFIFKNKLQGGAKTEDKVVLTALGIEDIEFEGQDNSVEDDNDLDEDPNFTLLGDEKNYRVFPGRRWAGSKPEGKPRDKVNVKVTLNVKPTRPVKLYFRSLDVDDPTHWDDAADTLADDEDNRGKTAKVNIWGKFPDTKKDYLEVEFDDIEQTFEFQVTMQPGDNFRIVGGGDNSTLMALENKDGEIPEYRLGNLLWIFDGDVLNAEADPDKARIPEHDKYVSDVLTVWRKLFIELDTMDSVTDNEHVEAKIVRIEPAGSHQIPDGNGGTVSYPKQTVYIDKNLYEQLPEESQSGLGGYEDNFSPGKLTVNNVNYNVVASTAYGSGGDRITIARLPGKPELVREDWGKTVILKDDDALENGDPLPPLDTSLLVEGFKPAYILPIWDPQIVPNATKKIPFMLHFNSDQTPYLRKIIRRGFDGWVYHNEPDFWLVYLLHAYQGKLDEDGDGEAGVSGLSGMADTFDCDKDNGFGAIVYYESGRETARNYASGGFGTGWQLKDVPVHEIAHLFSGDHADGGMMGYAESKSDEFEPITLHKMRSCAHP